MVLIGEPRTIGGNTVQLTSKGKVRITNAKGKTKDISVKSYQKQLLKNADKIQNGDDFEFKGSSTAKKVAVGVGIAGALTGLAAAIIYRKDIGRFAKEFKEVLKETNWKKFGDDFKKGLKDQVKPFFKEQFANLKKPFKNIKKQIAELELGEGLKELWKTPKKFFREYAKVKK